MIDEIAKELIYEAQSSDDVRKILSENNFLDRDLWKPIGDDFGNETLIRHQSPAPELAFGERCINSVDSILMRKCIENKIDPRGSDAPKSMLEAADIFCNVPDGKLSKFKGNLASICEIFCTATGREESKLTLNLVDLGEGQTPDYMRRSFFSLPIGRGSPYKRGIPFVQGRYNQGAGGSYKFSEFTLIVTKRAPSLLTPKSREIVDQYYDQSKITLAEIYDRKAEWGWTVVKKFPRRHVNEDTWYGYLAPDGKVPSFNADSLGLIPPEQIPRLPSNLSKKEEQKKLLDLRSQGTHTAYSRSIAGGTLVKLFDFPLKQAMRGDLWSEGQREMREKVFHELILPIKLTELREWGTKIKGKGDSAYLTGLLNSILQKDKGRNILVRDNWPKDETLTIESFGKKPIKITKWILDTEKADTDWLGDTSVIYVLNGQIHFKEKSSYLQRLKLYNLERSLLVVVNINSIPIDIRDLIFRVDRAHTEEYPEADLLKSEVQKIIKNDDDIKRANDEKFYEKTSDIKIDKKYSERIVKKLAKENPLLFEMLQGTKLPVVTGAIKLVKKKGEKYRNEKYGKKSPTFFQIKRDKKN
ncbi:MAG: hypothetical protein IIA82_08310 [Thaumarchaeota archaeon]|nr:hypothetical protein [Nitrososphaerota archaeon]